MASLELRGIHKFFQQQHSINDVSLKVEDGELLILLGPSGCGKSTLMRIISGLETPTEGEVLINDRAVTQLRPKDRNVAMVFQNYALYPHLSLYENIAFPLRVRGKDGIRGTSVDEKVRWAAKMVNIDHLLDRKPRQTSGGERQRTALARSLVRDPDVFLLDEPLSNLDAKMRHTAREDLREFQHRVKGTWVYVTHDQTEAMGMGDRVVVLNKGQIRQIGTPQEIYLRPADTFVATFVGMPPMNLIEADEDVIGFRPEHYLPRTFFGNESGLVDIPMRLRRVEYLGSERLFYGETEGRYPATRVIARIPGTLPYSQDIGELAPFAVRSSDLSLFDPETRLARSRECAEQASPSSQRHA